MQGRPVIVPWTLNALTGYLATPASGAGEWFRYRWQAHAFSTGWLPPLGWRRLPVRCDHKFINSVRCVKCRWDPPQVVDVIDGDPS